MSAARNVLQSVTVSENKRLFLHLYVTMAIGGGRKQQLLCIKTAEHQTARLEKGLKWRPWGQVVGLV